MKTNTKKRVVDFEELTQEQKDMVEKVFKECMIIFSSALLRIEKEIDNLIDVLYVWGDE